MEALFKRVAESIALGVEAVAVLVIAIGAIEAVVDTARVFSKDSARLMRRRDSWRRFAVWLLLEPEFELAADIVRTAIAPTWTSIGQLSAIGALRTVLNYFLEKGIERYESPERQLKAIDAKPVA